MIYLASPYTYKSDDEEKNKQVREERYRVSCEVAAKLFRMGVMVFSPLAHCHPMAEMFGLPTTWEFWEEYDREMLAMCDAVVIIKIPGWETSTGVRAERDIAEDEYSLPVYEIDPDGREELEFLAEVYGSASMGSG